MIYIYLTKIPETCQIAIFNTALSVKNFKAAMAVPAALGLDPYIAISGKSMTLEFFFIFYFLFFFILLVGYI